MNHLSDLFEQKLSTAVHSGDIRQVRTILQAADHLKKYESEAIRTAPTDQARQLLAELLTIDLSRQSISLEESLSPPEPAPVPETPTLFDLLKDCEPAELRTLLAAAASPKKLDRLLSRRLHPARQPRRRQSQREANARLP